MMYDAVNITFDIQKENNDVLTRQKRYRQICAILAEHPKGLTAKQISVEMGIKGFGVHTHNALYLTELCLSGIAKVVDARKCEYTDKTVAVYKLVKEYGIGY